MNDILRALCALEDQLLIRCRQLGEEPVQEPEGLATYMTLVELAAIVGKVRNELMTEAMHNLENLIKSMLPAGATPSITINHPTNQRSTDPAQPLRLVKEDTDDDRSDD